MGGGQIMPKKDTENIGKLQAGVCSCGKCPEEVISCKTDKRTDGDDIKSPFQPLDEQESYGTELLD